MTLDALASETGSILVFLPGLSEIRRVAEILGARIKRPDVDIAPLYGALDSRAQDLAIAAPEPGRRKIVLATSIAETSLTIEGVRVVIDSGLMRVPIYEPDVGLTRLETVRVSRANADQRRGRAGRVEPGVCYRLWEEAATGGLQPYGAPEILPPISRASRSTARSGASPIRRRSASSTRRRAQRSPRRRRSSRRLARSTANGRITDEGRAISRLALPPRLARMVVDAARAGDARTASGVAIVLTERGSAATRSILRPGSTLSPMTARRGPTTRGGSRGDWLQGPSPPAPLPEGEGGSAPFSPREKVAGEAGRMRVSAPCSPRPIRTASPSPAASAANS